MPNDIVYEYLRKRGLLTGGPGKDRHTFISLNWCGDVDPDTIPLDAEVEVELPEELQRVLPLDVN
jgi:hypothetical protein